MQKIDLKKHYDRFLKKRNIDENHLAPRIAISPPHMSPERARSVEPYDWASKQYVMMET